MAMNWIALGTGAAALLLSAARRFPAGAVVGGLVMGGALLLETMAGRRP